MELRPEREKGGPIVVNYALAIRSQKGFTLIEITIAILILAVSLVTLLGLQSSAVQESLRTRNKQKAMLLARQIMAAIENDEEPPETQNVTGRAYDILKKFAPFEKLGSGKDLEMKSESGADFETQFTVEDWKIPKLPEKALRRVYLKVSWSPSPADSLEVVYFVPILDEAE